MKYYLCILLAVLASRASLRAQLQISEFLANSVAGLRDEVNEHADWLEIENTTGGVVSLSGWYVTDDAERLRKWPFPGWSLAGGKRLVVFASNRDRRPVQAVAGEDNKGTAAQPRLATNFKISSNEGRYLALTREGAGGVVEVVSRFANYRKQVPDVSYGRVLANNSLLGPARPGVKALVPAVGNGGDGLGWAWRGGAEPFDDSSWLSQNQGVGVAGNAVPLQAAHLKLRLNAASQAELAVDSSGAGHLGVNTGETTVFQASAVDGAADPFLRRGTMRFVAAAGAASSSQVVVAASPALDAVSGTILFWMKAEATAVAMGGSEGAMLWDRRAGEGTVLVLTAAAQAQPGRLMSQPAGSEALYSTARVDDNRWHQVAFVYDQAAGGTDTFYVDGVASGSVKHAGAWRWPVGQPIELGRSHDSYWQKYQGMLDEVRFYDVALSAAEVAKLYRGADEAVEKEDVGLDLAGALEGKAGVYLRYPFVVADRSAVQSLRGTVRIRGGFVAYLNGVQVASFQAPEAPAWNSSATAGSHPGRALGFALPEAALVTGTNVLAIHAMKAADNDADFLALVTLDSVSGDPEGSYLVTNTPGAANGAVRPTVGPFVTEVVYNDGLALPPQPVGGAGSADLKVSAKIATTLRPLAEVSPVKLAWRIMYEPETLMDMALGADGRYVGMIPTSRLAAGQMLRWRVVATDGAGVVGTAPPYLNTTKWDQYYGTVALDNTATQLPVYQVFVSGTYAYNNTKNIDQDVGGRASFFYDGELYDNVFIRIKGDTTRNLLKRSHRVDFNPDHQFRWAAGRSRMRELALNAEYVDPAGTRQMLTMWLHRASGTGGPEHFPVHCRINGSFWQLAFHTETQDFELLDNMGLDPNGAMYASVGEMSGAGGEKQTRVGESTADMASFVSAISTANATTRKNNVFDQIDIPAVVNYLAVARITQEGDDVWANMVIHRDSDNTGEWRIIPFDANLSWGQLYYDDYPAGNAVIHANKDRGKSHPLYGNQSCYTLDYAGLRYNRFYNAIISVPETRAMLLRRMRSIMDRYLQAPGTDHPLLESMIDAHVARIGPEVLLDRARWGRPSNGGPYGFGNQAFSEAITQMKTLFLVPRRVHLFTTHTSAVNVGISNLNSAGIPATPQPAGVPIALSGCEAWPAGSTSQDEEYVQLSNSNAFAADLSGWSLSGGVEFTFKGGTVIPAGGSLYVSPRQAAFRARAVSPKRGEGKFVVGPYQGHLSSRGEVVELRDETKRLISTLTVTANPTLAQQFLRITELNYHPLDPSAAEVQAISSAVVEDFQYLELLNTGTAPLDLSGVRFTEGVAYTFPAGSRLEGGARVVVVANQAAFQLRYGMGASTVGPFLGSLDKGGESIQLVDGSGEVVLDFSYSDQWYRPSDGAGRTLVAREAHPSYSGYGTPGHWALSGSAMGTPGAADVDFASTFAGWRWAYFVESEITLPGGAEQVALVGAEADADGDGVTNFGEYAFGSHPRVAGAAGLVEGGVATEGVERYASASFLRPRLPLELHYEVQFSGDLASWERGSVELSRAALPGTDLERVTFRDAVPLRQGRRYARVLAWQGK